MAAVLAAGGAWRAQAHPGKSGHGHEVIRGTQGEATGKGQDWFLSRVSGLAQNSFEARLRYWLLARLGTPYAIGHLGEEQFPDKDPVFALDKADCTTFILTSTALAQSTHLAQARDRMEALNYRCQGLWCPVTYENRLHFTSDRIMGGSRSFQNITSAIKAPQETFETVRLVLNRKADGAPLLDLHWERPITLTYVRSSYVTANLLKQLPPLVGVSFIKRSYFTSGLAEAHEGVLLDQKDLIHASSVEKKVVKVSFLDYLRPRTGQPKFDGVMFYRILPGPTPQTDPLVQMSH